MEEFKEFQGKSLDEAIKSACAYFDTPREKLEIDIVQDAKNGIFGLVGARKALVRARRAHLRTAVAPLMGRTDSPLAPSAREDSEDTEKRERAAPRSQRRPGRERTEQPDTAERPERAERSERTEKVERTERGNRPPRPEPRVDRAERAERPERAERAERGERTESRPEGRFGARRSRSCQVPAATAGSETLNGQHLEDVTTSVSTDNVSISTPEQGTACSHSAQRLTPLSEGLSASEGLQPLDHDDAAEGFPDVPFESLDKAMLEATGRKVAMGLVTPILGEVEITINLGDNRLEVHVECGDDSGLLIGREGQTLAALQYLASRLVSREMNAPVRVQFDVGDYRERQDERLRELAWALAERVRETGRSCSTRPMSSYHRRIIHMTLQDETDVQTRSSGDGSLKRVVVQRRRADKRPPREE